MLQLSGKDTAISRTLRKVRYNPEAFGCGGFVSFQQQFIELGKVRPLRNDIYGVAWNEQERGLESDSEESNVDSIVPHHEDNFPYLIV